MAFPTEAKKTSKELLAPRSTELEFCGFPGALFVTIVVPIVAYFLAFGCSEELGCSLSLPVSNPGVFFAHARREFVASFTDTTAWALYFAWYAYCVIAWFVLPSKWVKGLPLRTGEVLEYKTNGTWKN